MTTDRQILKKIVEDMFESNKEKETEGDRNTRKESLLFSKTDIIRELYWSANYLDNVPESIGQLQNLQKLFLSVNNITSIPESIGQLQELYTLDLSINKLTTLPESIKELKNLQNLSLYGNNFVSLPPGVLYLRDEIGTKIVLADLANRSLDDLVDAWSGARRVDEDVPLSIPKINPVVFNWVEQEAFESGKYVFSFVPEKLDLPSLEYLSLEETQLLLSDRIDAGRGSILRKNLSEIKRPLGTVLIPQGESYLEEGLTTIDRLDILTEWININRKLPDRHNHHILASPSNVVGFKYRQK